MLDYGKSLINIINQSKDITGQHETYIKLSTKATYFDYCKPTVIRTDPADWGRAKSINNPIEEY